MSSISKPLNLSNMNTTERIVSVFNNDELKVLITALQRYKSDRPSLDTMDLMEKLINGFFLSNELEAEHILVKAKENPYDKSIPTQFWGTARGKEYLMELEEGSTKAYSY